MSGLLDKAKKIDPVVPEEVTAEVVAETASMNKKAFMNKDKKGNIKKNIIQLQKV